jgi:hypothetical protein
MHQVEAEEAVEAEAEAEAEEVEIFHGHPLAHPIQFIQ